jgi:DNA-binding SARP family transcriptional activator
MVNSFGILGPLQVLKKECSLDVGSRKQQIVLAALLCNANSLVSVESLAEALWDDEPPRTARKNIQVYVSALRGLVSEGPGSRITYQTGGYIFHAYASELDALCFEQKARARHRLRQGEQPSAVAHALAGALDLWRGRALDGMRDVPLICAAAQRLERLYLAVFEDWAEAEIAAGGAAGAIERVADMTQEHPLRERLRILQMTALCQAGRRAEALAVYDELRLALAHELGLSPSPAVDRLYQSLLRGQEPSAPPPRRQASPSLLPWDPATFTGQAACTRQLTDALVSGGHRLAVVTGPLGAGKTALAVHTAHQLGRGFPDGRFFVRLRGEDGTLRPPEEIISRLLWPVMHGTPPEPEQDVRRAWQLWLAGHRALVILDDARHESEVRPLLPEAGDSAVIVTARSRLAGLESAYRLSVPPLSLAEAVEFLGRVTGPGRVAADRAAAQRIVTAAGALPLGLRLVAERLALLQHVPLREYAARLESAPALLDELTTGDVAIRPRLAQAIGELPGPASRAMARLGTLPEAIFTLDEAAAVLDGDEDTAVRVLETLLEASVITVPDAETLAHTVLYEMPVLTHAYVREISARRPAAIR